MFTVNTIADISTPIATMEFLGTTTADPSIRLPRFVVNLGKAYRGDSALYLFKLTLQPGVDLDCVDIDEVKETLINAFEELLEKPAVVAQYGRITLTGTVTRTTLRIRLGKMVFGDRAVTKGLGRPKRVLAPEEACA